MHCRTCFILPPKFHLVLHFNTLIFILIFWKSSRISSDESVTVLDAIAISYCVYTVFNKCSLQLCVIACKAGYSGVPYACWAPNLNSSLRRSCSYHMRSRQKFSSRLTMWSKPSSHQFSSVIGKENTVLLHKSHCSHVATTEVLEALQ